jgi:hypothetical protein
MADERAPADCKHYPLCEPLRTLIGQLSLKLLDTYTAILTTEAESVCSRCDDFEPREMIGKTH